MYSGPRALGRQPANLPTPPPPPPPNLLRTTTNAASLRIKRSGTSYQMGNSIRRTNCSLLHLQQISERHSCRSECALLLIETGFCRDLGCVESQIGTADGHRPTPPLGRGGTDLHPHWQCWYNSPLHLYRTYPLHWPELDHTSPLSGDARDTSSRTWTRRP